MSHNDSADDPKLVVPTVNPQYNVVLPCEPEQFREFVSGLLGKPQTIEKEIPGVFEITRRDVTNTFHLVDQRIHQQNDASLIQFTVRILYDDNSSVLLNSLQDFDHHAEIKPIASVGVVLSWTYLIKFNNKLAPEKQEITISMRGGKYHQAYDDDDFYSGLNLSIYHRYGPFSIFLRINHTERTWGVDIESLLTGHIKTLIKNPTGSKKFITRHSGAIGLSTGALLFLGSILGVILTSSQFINSYLEKVRILVGDATTNDAILSSKLDFLIEVISTGVWPRYIFTVVVFIVISLILSVALGTWVSEAADNRPISYVLLSKAAEDQRIKKISKMRRDWLMFTMSIVTSIFAGIVSNIIFTKYFSGIA